MSFEGTDKTQDTILEIDNMNSSDTEQSKKLKVFASSMLMTFLFSVTSSTRSLQTCIRVILRH